MPERATERHTILTGIGVSAGTATGPVVHVPPAPTFDADETPTTDAAAASERVRDTLDAVAEGLKARAEVAPDGVRQVLEGTAMMALDPGLAAAIDTKLAEGAGLTRAVHDAVGEYVAMFERLGGYMAERTADLRDVRDRAISRLLGLAEPGVPELTEPSILVAEDLAPAETATLDPDTVLAVVTAGAGPTGHTAVLAAGLGIPAVVQVKGATALMEGAVLALDGGVGEVIVSPTAHEQEQLAARARRRAAALAGSSGEGATKDAHRIALLGNTRNAAEALVAAQDDIEGIGLFRTEFLFLNRDTAPSVEEQTAVYTEVLTAYGDRRVVVRTLDAGADSPLPFVTLEEEKNPALGRRGLRLGMARQELLDTQLQALANAWQATRGDLRVMAPMVTTVDEAEWFATRARELGLPTVGLLVEVPSAALMAEELFDVVDFVSVGTNDLVQYTMAADRGGNRSSRTPGRLLSPWQPAVLRLLAMTCEASRLKGKKVSVSGAAAGDPLLALVLVGLGVSSLSMAPSKVKAVRASLRLHDMHECIHMGQRALRARTAGEAKAVVEELMAPALVDLL